MFVNGTCDLTRFEWVFADILKQEGYYDTYQDAPDLHRLYDGAHLYPLETVQFLIGDGFLKASPDTLPFGWAPMHRRPASDLREALGRIRSTWEAVPLDAR